MTVLVPMTVEQDEDGWWCAHAQLGPNVGANGQGRTRKEALDDLREAVLASFEADGGVPDWLVRSGSSMRPDVTSWWISSISLRS